MKNTAQDRICHSPIVGDVIFQLVSSRNGSQHVVLCGEFERQNMTVVQLPFLASVPGAPASGRIRLHKIAAPSLVAAFTELNESIYWKELLSYDGAFVPRLIRGSYDILSNHALGIAIDLNAAWNPMGKPPTPAGETGSLFNIAEIFKSYGWSWGGDWRNPDAMHLEYIGRVPA